MHRRESLFGMSQRKCIAMPASGGVLRLKCTARMPFRQYGEA